MTVNGAADGLGKGWKHGTPNKCGNGRTSNPAEEQVRAFLADPEHFAIKKDGDPCLRVPCRTLENFSAPWLPDLAKKMGEKMAQARGIGIAGPQVGVTLRIFVVDLLACIADGNSTRAVLDGFDLLGSLPSALPLLFAANATVTAASEELETREEGCLSLPEITAKVTRPRAITMEFQDLAGRPHRLSADGLLACCCQHENDHTHGILFTDRARESGGAGPAHS